MKSRSNSLIRIFISKISLPIIVIIRILKSRRVSWERHIACTGEMRNVYKIGSRNSETKRRWENNIKVGFM
jgi:hypothetical protein